MALAVFYFSKNKAGEPVAEEKKPDPKDESKIGVGANGTTAVGKLPPEPSREKVPLDPAAVHERLMKSTVLVFTADSRGLGILVHAEKKLFVTTDSLIRDEKTVEAMAPIVEGTGVVTDLDAYHSKKGALGIAGRVKAQDATKNLALIELDRLPDGLQPVGFAIDSPTANAPIFAITGADGPPARVWRPLAGTFTSRAKRKVETPRGSIVAMQVQVACPLREADSGGPLANDRGELTALVAEFAPVDRLPSAHIDVAEVRAFLADYFEGNGEKWTDPVSPGGGGSDLPNLNALIAVVRVGVPADRVIAVRRLGKLGSAARTSVPVLLAALDGADPQLELAIEETLALIGPPDPAAGPVVIRALASNSRIGRNYAMQQLSSAATIPDEAGPALVAALTDPSAVVRAQAATALGKLGERARPFALGPLLDRAADSDPGVRMAADAAIQRLGKPGEPEFPVLAEKRAADDARVRTAALDLSVPLIASAEDAEKVWVPFLKDPVPELRLRAVRGMLAHPDSLPKFAPQVLALLADPDKAVRAAAIEAAGHLRGVAGVPGRVEAAFLKETDPEVRAAAANAIVELAEPTPADVSVLCTVLKDGPATARCAAADKLALLKAEAAPAVDDLIAQASGEDEPEVQAASIKALAAIGPEARKAVPLAAKLFNATGTPASVRNAAIDLLAASGSDGLKVLKAGIGKPLPTAAKVRMCRAFASAGADARDLHPWMIDLAETAPDCRDDVTEALVKAGDEKAVLLLLKRTELFKLGGEERYPTSYRVWAVETLGKLNLTKIAQPDTRARVMMRMKDLVTDRDTDPDVRRAATIVAMNSSK